MDTFAFYVNNVNEIIHIDKKQIYVDESFNVPEGELVFLIDKYRKRDAHVCYNLDSIHVFDIDSNTNELVQNDISVFTNTYCLKFITDIQFAQSRSSFVKYNSIILYFSSKPTNITGSIHKKTRKVRKNIHLID